MHPHQRLSAADGITDPLPGFLIGGPNRGQQDKEYVPEYPSSIPDESYMDHEGSYASNEVAINWNAYLVNLLSWF
jgi:endoglucanase